MSWILRNITDPEGLDAALPLTGEIRWFDDGVDVDPPYDQIVSTFEACFDSTRTLYPGSRDRAYHSGRAMIWIHTLAMCKSEEFANTFPLPNFKYATPVPDPDLDHLFRINDFWFTRYRLLSLYSVIPESSPSHLQRISNILLHCSWANRTELDHGEIRQCVSASSETEDAIPLNVTLNHLLVWCTFLGSPVEEEVLKVQDKSYDFSCFYSSSCSLLFTSDRIQPIMDRLSKAVLSAINGTRAQREFIQYMLRDLVKLENRPVCLTKIAYKWCSAIYEHRESLEDWERLVLLCLEIGFRHLDFQSQYIEPETTHTEHHRGLVDVVFRRQEGEAIVDLLHAWTTRSNSHEPAHELLVLCAGHLDGLHNLVQSSSRLRRLVIRSVEVIGCKGFEEVGVERFIDLLDHLRVTVEDMDYQFKWATLLVDTIERTHYLSQWYWELMVEHAVSRSRWPEFDFAQGLQTITSLAEAKEWSKLECWMGIVWMVRPREANAMAEGDLSHSMLLLFRQRPEAVQKLEQWMERRGQKIPESFTRICKQAHEAVQRDTP